MFSEKDYWNKRYSKTKGIPYEYISPYEYLSDIIKSFGISKSSKFLFPGCGSSLIPERLYDEGYINITCIDFSSVIINELKEKNSNQRSNIQYIECDVRSLDSIYDDTFDLIIDKGTLDCVLCSNSPYISCLEYMTELQRVVKQTGNIMIISCGENDKRLFHFERINLSLNVRVLYIERVFLSLPIFNKKNSQNSQVDEINSLSSQKIVQYIEKKDLKEKSYNYIYILNKKHDWRQKSLNYSIVYDNLVKEERLDEINEDILVIDKLADNLNQ